MGRQGFTIPAVFFLHVDLAIIANNHVFWIHQCSLTFMTLRDLRDCK